MAYIKFKNKRAVNGAVVVKPQGSHVIRIEGEEPNVSGFRLYLDKEKKFPLDKESMKPLLPFTDREMAGMSCPMMAPYIRSRRSRNRMS